MIKKQNKKYVCPKCGSKLNFEKKNISPGYFGACLTCDEDFYKIELK